MKDSALDTTIKDIYSAVVKTSFRNKFIEKFLLENVTLDDMDIITLFQNYKSQFSVQEWKKICIFEHHFGNSSFYNESDSYETVVEQKVKFLDMLQEAHKIQNVLLSSSSCQSFIPFPTLLSWTLF